MVSGAIEQTDTETFQYDKLNRLTRSDHSDGTTTEQQTYRYDAIGNLTYKSDISSSHYRYGSQSTTCSTAGPHAAVEVDGHCLSYDANGNQSTGYNFSKRRARTLTWTPYNKPRTIQEGATTLTFSYGADRARFKQVNTATNLTTYYIGGLYEKQVNSVTGLTTHVHYIKAGGTTIATYKVKENTNTSNTNSNTNTTGTGTSTSTEAITELHYLHRDHLGSVTEITDENAAVVERLAYDAWGKRRAPTWTDVLAQLSSNQTLRGFTGHEMLDDVSLIHMNGRVYDPDLGRFLSPDPHIQSPANPQSHNRYTYVLNNPLSFTDPSGFFFKKIFKGIGKVFKGIGKAFKAIGRFTKKHIRTIAAIGVLFIPGINVYAAGFISGMIASGGDLKAGIISALTAGTFEYVGGLDFVKSFGDVAFAAKAVAHGVVGGVSSVAQGGKFLAGFASAGVAQTIGGSKFVRGLTKAGQGIARIVTGGLASVAGGGKFKNGAITAAFAYAFGSIVRSAQAAESAQSTGVNEGVCTSLVCRPTWLVAKHCSVFVAQCGNPGTSQIERQYSLAGFATKFELQNSTSNTFFRDNKAYRNPGGSNQHFPITPPAGLTARQFADRVIEHGDNYSAPTYNLFGPNSNSAAAFPFYRGGASMPNVYIFPGFNYYGP